MTKVSEALVVVSCKDTILSAGDGAEKFVRPGIEIGGGVAEGNIGQVTARLEVPGFAENLSVIFTSPVG
jgi:hypothetical protein